MVKWCGCLFVAAESVVLVWSSDSCCRHNATFFGFSSPILHAQSDTTSHLPLTHSGPVGRHILDVSLWLTVYQRSDPTRETGVHMYI